MPASLQLRPATKDDCRLLWEWANDPVVRAASFETEPIPWEDHVRWFEGKLQDRHCRIWIALSEAGNPIGQIRFDAREDGDAEADVHLAPGQRGKGYGILLIAEGVRAFFRSTDIPAVHSFIKVGNAASRHAFLKAGFQEQGREHLHGQEVYHLIFRHP